AFLVGMVGLATFAPLFLLALPAGATVDRSNRKGIMVGSLVTECAVVAAMAAASFLGRIGVPFILVAAMLVGAARAFLQPSQTALGPMLVPRALLPRAIAWNSLAGQSSSIIGAGVGGLLVAISPWVAYGAAGGLYLLSAVMVLSVRHKGDPPVQAAMR